MTLMIYRNVRILLMNAQQKKKPTKYININNKLILNNLNQSYKNTFMDNNTTLGVFRFGF